jgi:ABC-type sugar transport system permease subunit
MSFYIVHPSRDVFVGLTNYRELIADPVFHQSVVATVKFSLFAIPFAVLISLFVALAVSYKPIRAKIFFKVIYFLPMMTSWVVVGIIWKWFFDYKFGVVNAMLSVLNLPAQKWLVNPSLTIFAIAGVVVWKFLGFFIVIFLANLQSIDETLYEAARMDGANKWQVFKYITTHQLRPAFILTLLMASIYFFRSFSIVYIMTGGGPRDTTNLLAHYIYTEAFQLMKFEKASGAVILLFSIIFALAMIQILVARKGES